MRPDGDLAREARLGQVERIIADPERASLVAGLGTVHTFVLGGGAGPRDLGTEGVIDMEQIDPAAVELPRWYRPNPGRAGDLAFIVFSGEGENTRMSRITNRRWAQSAFGTASSAALDPRRHRVQRDSDLPPVGADDEHRRRDRRRRAAGHGAASSTCPRSGRRCAATG